MPPKLKLKGHNTSSVVTEFSCYILSPYRGSFNVSIGLNEASCSGRGPRLACPLALSGSLQHHILSARLVPVNDLDTSPEAAEKKGDYCWGGMLHGASKLAWTLAWTLPVA